MPIYHVIQGPTRGARHVYCFIFSLNNGVISEGNRRRQPRGRMTSVRPQRPAAVLGWTIPEESTSLSWKRIVFRSVSPSDQTGLSSAWARI